MSIILFGWLMRVFMGMFFLIFVVELGALLSYVPLVSGEFWDKFVDTISILVPVLLILVGMALVIYALVQPLTFWRW